jgi:hypothetical protein
MNKKEILPGVKMFRQGTLSGLSAAGALCVGKEVVCVPADTIFIEFDDFINEPLILRTKRVELISARPPDVPDDDPF